MPPQTQDDLSQYEVKPQAQGDDLSKYEVKPQAAPTWDQQHPVLSTLEDVGAGAAKGLMHTGMGLSPLINKIPYVGETLAPSAGIKAGEEISTPKGTAQKIGYGGEQTAEWLLPTGAEEKAGQFAAETLPQLGKAAPIIARIGTGALEGGIKNKIQGGSFTHGAEAGGAMSVLPAVARGVDSVLPAKPAEPLVTQVLKGAGKGAKYGAGYAAITAASHPQDTLADPVQALKRGAEETLAGTVIGGGSPIVSAAGRGILSKIGEMKGGPDVAPTPPAAAAPSVVPPISPTGVTTPSVPPIKPQTTGKMVDTMLRELPGNEPLKPNVPLREQIVSPITQAQAETDPMKIKYPDSAVRQMVRANGEKIVDAVGNDPGTMKAVHDLTRVDLRNALIASGEDMGQTTVSDSKFAGQGSIGRQQAFEKLLDKGLKPADIVRLAKQPLKP